MNSLPPAADKRPYRQGARAEAAEATGRRIIDALIAAWGKGWMEDVTLDQIATEAGVTVQTVIRRFGGKEGLVQAAAQEFGRQVMVRRELTVGDLDRAIANLMQDYEVSGDMVIRWLAQEERFPALKPMLDYGRSEHRRWLGEIAAPWLDPLDKDERRRRLDALVVAADVYTWKLLRRDMGRPRAETRSQILRLARAALDLSNA
jgi:AcrR family transcriptional regulator